MESQDKQDFDVVYVDDEKAILDLFSGLACAKHPDWWFETRHDPAKLYKDILENRIRSRVWIIDIMMPKRNGAEIAEAIRRSPHGKGAYILGYTALDLASLSAQPEYRERLKHFDRLVNKREDFGRLLFSINQLLVQSKS